MAKTLTAYVCQNCGAVHVRWAGRCDECGEWNSIVEEQTRGKSPHERAPITDESLPLPVTRAEAADTKRFSTGIVECDRVLGGGVVPGSLTLLGGDPGIGKSTLMLQIGSHLARSGNVLYISGEESFSQTRMRAGRLGAMDDHLFLLTETNVEAIRQHLAKGEFQFAVVDSIQSVYSPNLPGSPGSVGQVRECAGEFLRVAKGLDVPVFLVGHVTKSGNIAGPRVLEHLVDTVLYFEGEGQQTLRILRAVKNRFGSTDEIGVFEMTEKGLEEVSNPSALFLHERPEGVSGSVVFPSIEGTRPLLVEVQALVTDTPLASPRRTVAGVNPNRVSLLLAVLEKGAGLHLSDRDVFVNVAGGVRLDKPAADVAVALALASSLTERPVPQALAAFGEVGLSGEVRAVDRPRHRLAEASTFGFTKCILPAGCKADGLPPGMEALPVANLAEAVREALEM